MTDQNTNETKQLPKLKRPDDPATQSTPNSVPPPQRPRHVLDWHTLRIVIKSLADPMAPQILTDLQFGPGERACQGFTDLLRFISSTIHALHPNEELQGAAEHDILGRSSYLRVRYNTQRGRLPFHFDYWVNGVPHVASFLIRNDRDLES